jgi:hypothetical protein
LNCFQSTCCHKVYASLGRIMFQRVRMAGRVLPGNFLKIHSQDLFSFLYASKRCSSRSDHRLCLLVLEWLCSSSLEQLSSSLLGSGLSLSLKLLSLLLLAGSLPPCATVSVSTALPCWSMVEGTSLGIGFAFVAVDRIILFNES